MSSQMVSAASFGVRYQTHVQDIGWQDWKRNGEIAGTNNQSLRLEAIKIGLENAPEGIDIEYKAHIQDLGWQDLKKNYDLAGTTGLSLKIEAIEIKINNASSYHVKYRAHVQDIGWQDWVYDGDLAGTTGKNLRLEAIQIEIVDEAGSEVFSWDSRCDINNDFVVDQIDINEVLNKYNTTPFSQNWNPKCDINKDNIVDIFDIGLVSKANGKNIDPIGYVSAKDIEARIDSNIRPEFKNVINNDWELLNFYNSSESEQLSQINLQANILKNINFEDTQINRYAASFSLTSNLSELNRQLIAIGIPASLRYGLVAEGAGISAALADGPLPYGDIAALAITIGVGFVIIANWDIIEEKSEQIMAIFNNVYSSIANKIEYAVSESFELIENAAEEKERNLPVKDVPNSVRERVRDGKVVQRRHYDEEGKARVDEDLVDHGTPHLHSNPHYHKWDWSTGKPKRSKTINWFD